MWGRSARPPWPLRARRAARRAAQRQPTRCSKNPTSMGLIILVLLITRGPDKFVAALVVGSCCVTMTPFPTPGARGASHRRHRAAGVRRNAARGSSGAVQAGARGPLPPCLCLLAPGTHLTAQSILPNILCFKGGNLPGTLRGSRREGRAQEAAVAGGAGQAQRLHVRRRSLHQHRFCGPATRLIIVCKTGASMNWSSRNRSGCKLRVGRRRWPAVAAGGWVGGCGCRPGAGA